jgi:putative ABC transport system ATP-binding protein
MLSLSNVCKTFDKGGVNEKTALQGISIDIPDGQFVTLIGSNGTGKSTLLNCIAGLYPIDEGSIALGGQEITKLPEYKRAAFIGRVFQDPLSGTAPSMTVEENMALALHRGGRRGLTPGIAKGDAAYFAEKLEILGLGLEGRMKQPVSLLSGGQRQALALLMSALKHPKLLLLDEHTAALDPAIAKKVMALTEELVREGKLTALMVTHNMKAALACGGRTVMMDEGRIILDLSGAEREKMTVDKLVTLFEKRSGHILDDDKMLLAGG